MPWSSQDLANIDAVIATGAKEVRFQDRTQVFQSTADLLRVRAEIVSYLAQNGGPPQVRVVRAYTKSGW